MASAKKDNKISTLVSAKKSAKKAVKKNVSEKAVFHSDYLQTEFLVKAGKRVSDQALREAKALGLEIMYIENGVLYREQDGKREVVSVVNLPKQEKYKKIKKGVTLYVKK